MKEPKTIYVDNAITDHNEAACGDVKLKGDFEYISVNQLKEWIGENKTDTGVIVSYLGVELIEVDKLLKYIEKP